jgi:hypothetical protein
MHGLGACNGILTWNGHPLQAQNVHNRTKVYNG